MPLEADKPSSIDDLARAFLKSEGIKVGPGLADVQMEWARREVLRLREESTQRSLEALMRPSVSQSRREPPPRQQKALAPNHEEGTADSSPHPSETRRTHSLSPDFRNSIGLLIQRAVGAIPSPSTDKAAAAPYHFEVWAHLCQQVEANTSGLFTLIDNNTITYVLAPM